MKKTILFAIITVFLAACGGGEENPELEKVVKKRDSLKAVHDSIGAEISALELLIVDLDPDIEKRISIVTTKTLKRKTFSHTFDVHGTVESDKNAMVFPETAGEIKTIQVTEGQRVSKGALLATIDTEIIRKNIAQVQSQLDLAILVYNKQKNLWDQNIGSEIQFQEAKTNKETLERNKETLQAQLDLANVKAPFAGIVDEVFPKVGELGGPQAPLLRLVNLEDVYIKSDVSESYLGRLSNATKVTVNFPSLETDSGSYDVDTTIAQIGNFINPNNRTFKIKINLENSDSKLKPNLLAVVSIKDFEADSVVVVPASVIKQGIDGKNFLYVVDRSEEKVQARKITGLKLGKTNSDGEKHVISGLNGDEEIVVDGADRIVDGEEVLIKGEEKAKKDK